MTVKQVYNALYKHYGAQHWWPGESPFEVMVGAVLTQNTAWTNVEKAINNLKVNDVLTPEKIANLHVKRLASWLKPSGYFNVKAKRLKAFCRWLREQGGEAELRNLTTHDLRHALLSVHGVGPETADDMLLYAFDRPVFVIDAYTRRLFQRLGLITGNEGYETLRHWFETKLDDEKQKVALFNEYHALIVRHAKEVCRTKPNCAECCMAKRCKKAGLNASGD